MKCPGCGNELRKHEMAQPMWFKGERVPIRSFCDDCCRKGQWKPGDAKALERLIFGDRPLSEENP